MHAHDEQVDRHLDALVRCLAHAATPRPQKSRPSDASSATTSANAAAAATAAPLAAAADVVLKRRWLLCVALLDVLHALRLGEFVDRSPLDAPPVNQTSSSHSPSPPSSSSDDSWQMSDGSSDDLSSGSGSSNNNHEHHVRGQRTDQTQPQGQQHHKILRVSGGSGVFSLAARLRLELGRAAFLETMAPLIMAAEGWPLPPALQAFSSSSESGATESAAATAAATAAANSRNLSAGSLSCPDRAARLGCLDLCLWLIAPPHETEQPLPNDHADATALAAATAAAAAIPFTPIVPMGMRHVFRDHRRGAAGGGNNKGAAAGTRGEVSVATGTWHCGRPLSHSPAAWSLAGRHCKAHALGQALADAVASGAWNHRVEHDSSSAAVAAAHRQGCHHHPRQRHHRNKSGDEFVGMVVARLLPDLTLPEPNYSTSSAASSRAAAAAGASSRSSGRSASRAANHTRGLSSSLLLLFSTPLDPPLPRWLGMTVATGLLPHAPMSTKLAASMGLTVLSKCEVRFEWENESNVEAREIKTRERGVDLEY